MKCSACCTTPSNLVSGPQSFPRIATALAYSAILLFGQGTPKAAAQNADAGYVAKLDQLDAWNKVNTLLAESDRAFHLHTLIQIYDLQGKPKEKGTLDLWWAGKEGYAVQLQLPSLGTRDDLAVTPQSSPDDLRTLYLVRQMLELETNPLKELNWNAAHILAYTETFAQVPLLCLTQNVPSENKNSATVLQGKVRVCLDPKTQAVRFIHSPTYTVVRDKLVGVGTTKVALSTSVFWGGKLAITGTIQDISGFKAANPSVTLRKDRPNVFFSSLFGYIDAPGLRLVKANAPEYPKQAMLSQSEGMVVLTLTISETGAPKAMAPLASPDPSLSAAAMQAVAGWRWTPFQQDGVATPIQTTIEVYFDLGLRR